MRSGPLCAHLWRILTWCSRKQVTLKARHIPAKCGSRQAIQASSDHPNGVVSSSRGLPVPDTQTSSRHVCFEVQQQVISVCVASFGLLSLGSGCTQSAMEGYGPLCLPTSSHSGQSGVETNRLPLQENHPACSRVAQHSLVLGPGGKPNPTVLAQPADSTLQSNSTQESVKP